MTSAPTNKKLTVDDLIALGGAEPPIMLSPPQPPIVAEIMTLYRDLYAPGLSYFFESQWYDLSLEKGTSTSQTIHVMLHSTALMGLFGHFVEHISSPGLDAKYASQLEECLVWGMARLPFYTNSPGWTLPATFRPDLVLPALNDPHEAQGRLKVFEALLLGPNSTLTENPVCDPARLLGTVQGPRRDELEFWRNLGDVALLGPHADLDNLRVLLGTQENRDFLYSLAVLRKYSHLWHPGHIEQQLPSLLTETDPRCKLAVAVKIMRNAMQNGTSNVVRRFASLVWRAYVKPGVNINIPVS